MNRLAKIKSNAARRASRVRTLVRGSSERPRLSVNISHQHVTAQIIDDSQSKTLVYVTTVGQKVSGNLTAKAEWVGKEIAAKARKAGVKTVALDRGSKQYHGRVKALADSARSEGLEF